MWEDPPTPLQGWKQCGASQWIVAKLDTWRKNVFSKKEGLSINELAKFTLIGLNNGGNPWYIPSDWLSKQTCESAANTVCDIRSLSAPQLSPRPGGGGKACVKSQSYSGEHTARRPSPCVPSPTHTPSGSVALGSTWGSTPRKPTAERLANLLHAKPSWLAALWGKEWLWSQNS